MEMMHGQGESGFAHFEGPTNSETEQEPKRNRNVLEKQSAVYCR